jgi:mRNA interferase MazF
MPNMTSYDRGDVVLATLPFSDLSGMKKRPTVVINAPHPSVDLLLLPLTSQTQNLQLGEFLLQEWQKVGLLFPSAVKRGLFTLDRAYVTRRLGHLATSDLLKLDETLRMWFGLLP